MKVKIFGSAGDSLALEKEVNEFIKDKHQKMYQGHVFEVDHVKKEFGDLLWFIAEYCTAKGWSLDDTKQLIKGVLAVTLLGAIMTAMVWATRGANDVKGNIIAIAVAIGVMAAAVAALSMIDSTKLAVATTCLGALIGMFAIMELAGSKAKDSIGTIAAMVVAVAALAGILGAMSALQVENALPNALALSALLLSLSVSMAIIGKVGGVSLVALASVGVMTLVVAALAGILYLIRDLNPESSIGNAEALSVLLLSLSASCGILAAVGLAGTAGFVGIGVLAALITAVGAIVVASIRSA